MGRQSSGRPPCTFGHLRVPLRRILNEHAPDVRIAYRAGGYAALAVEPTAVDVSRFQSVVGQARQAAATGDDHRAAQAFSAALASWRGEPLAGLSGDWASTVAADLNRQCRDAHADHIDALLRLGRATEVLDPLHRLTTAYPLDEQFAGQLIQALHQAGRTAEALSHFETVRRRLADELGADPSPSLQEVHLRLLRAEPVRAAVHAGSLVPAQLPADVPAFTGRVEHLAELDRLLEPDGGSPAVVISAIAGTAGVGKTALAVHWGHRVRHRFPDGQLFVNLRGFDPAEAVTDPAEALRSFLVALHVPPQHMPHTIDGQTALYRSLLADRRMLILLDNARDTAQVRLLLPGAPGCLVLVTSRNALTGLVATQAARPLVVDLLSLEEGREMLARRLGTERAATEPDAVHELITRCARLPLALAIVAARAAIRPRLTMAAIAAELAESHDRLDALVGDDPASDIRAVFSWSYHTLSPPAARLFRLLGLHPGPDLSLSVTASIAGLPTSRVRRLVAELRDAHLVEEHLPGRYTLHDLLRVYAAARTAAQDGVAERRAATHRMLDHYLHTSYHAAIILQPVRSHLRLGNPAAGATTDPVASYEEASAWFDAEHAALLAAVNLADRTGWDLHTWQLAWTLLSHLDHRGQWHDIVTTSKAAAAAAVRLADPAAHARAHHFLAAAYLNLLDLDAADMHLHSALDLYLQTENAAGQAHIHHNLAILYERKNDPGQALHHGRQALAMHAAAGDEVGQANALNAIGWQHALLGQYEEAQAMCERSVVLHRVHDNRDGQAEAMDSLGYIHHHLGRHSAAVTCYRTALDILRQLGDRYSQARVLDHLGDTHLTTGDTNAAREAYHESLTILKDLDHPDTTEIHTKLATLIRNSS